MNRTISEHFHDRTILVRSLQRSLSAEIVLVSNRCKNVDVVGGLEVLMLNPEITAYVCLKPEQSSFQFEKVVSYSDIDTVLGCPK